MTKQDIIREGIGTWLSYFKEGKQGLTVDDGVEWIIGYLHSQGVVIKVDRELPDNEAWHKVAREFEAYCAGRNDMADRVAVEPLIEEG